MGNENASSSISPREQLVNVNSSIDKLVVSQFLRSVFSASLQPSSDSFTEFARLHSSCVKFTMNQIRIPWLRNYRTGVVFVS